MNLDAINQATKNNTRLDGVSSFSELELAKVYPNPDQPRKSFSDIEELASSIEVNGLIQPIAVVKVDKKYMIISGERRYRACCHLELQTINAHIIQADEKQVLELSLVENIQRDDLTDFEKARFINQLWSSGNYEKKQDLAKAIGKPSSYLSKVFKAVKICDAIIEDIELNKRDIGLEILQELSNIKDEEIQLEVYQQNPTREKIRNVVWLAKENKKYRNLEVPQVSPAKKKFIVNDETYTKHGLESYLIERITKKLQYSKSYKITIEEV